MLKEKNNDKFGYINYRGVQNLALSYDPSRPSPT